MKFTAILCLVFMISCTKTKTINFDPYNPNIGINVSDLEDNGWRQTILDDGICAYEKSQNNQKLLFYLDMNEACKTVKAQELHIDLKIQENDSKIENQKLIVDKKIVGEIDSILLTYDSKRISEIKRIASCNLEFTGKNYKNKTIKWRLFDCLDTVKLTTYSELN